MKTTKPISCISYNSDAYLKLKLDELLTAKKIQFWCFIRHKPEVDEKKEHIHCYIEPAKLIQTMDFEEHFKEFCPQTPTKPLKCIGFRKSDFDNWFMYSLHDRAYLASKGESRKFHYDRSDFVSSDDDELDFRINQIDRVALSPFASIAKAKEQHLTFEQFAISASIPILQIKQWQYAWSMFSDYTLQRNGHENHEDPAEPQEDWQDLNGQDLDLFIDKETGELKQ